MKPGFRRWKILFFSLLASAVIVIAKAIFHWFGWDLIGYSPLYATIITGGFFVLGFILSATIADYKEAEKLPAEFSAIIENMYEDGLGISVNYKAFKIDKYQKQLLKILKTLRGDIIHVTRETHHEVHQLNERFTAMERAKVPPNFITKLKQEQGQLIKLLFRTYYIQTIQFIPSAIVLARAITASVIVLLLFSRIEPASASLWLTAVISFVFIYLNKLIQIISVPFQPEGSTQDDVSLFLIDRAIAHLEE